MDKFSLGTKNIVSKGNDLVEAKYKLPLIEHRLLDLAISKINPNQSKGLMNPYRITVKEYAELLDLEPSGQLYGDLYRAVKTLMTRTLLKHDDSLQIVRIFHWVKTVHCHYGNGFFDFYFHEELEPELVVKSKFTKYHIEQAYRLTGKYTYRVFQFLKKWESAKSTPVMEINDFKERIGVSLDEYKSYASFKQRVLKQSSEELKNSTDIRFETVEIKEGRKVVRLKFKIFKNNPSLLEKKKRGRPQKNYAQQEENIFDLINKASSETKDSLIGDLKKYGIAEKNISKYGESALKYGLEQVQKIDGDPLRLGGVVIQSAKDFTLKNESEVKIKKEEELSDNLSRSNKIWLENREGKANRKLTRHDQAGVWREVPDKKVILFKDIDFIEKVLPSFTSAV